MNLNESKNVDRWYFCHKSFFRDDLSEAEIRNRHQTKKKCEEIKFSHLVGSMDRPAGEYALHLRWLISPVLVSIYLT